MNPTERDSVPPAVTKEIGLFSSGIAKYGCIPLVSSSHAKKTKGHTSEYSENRLYWMALIAIHRIGLTPSATVI